MTKTFLVIAFFSIVCILPIRAHAVFEFRAHYDFLSYSPEDMNSTWTGSGKLKLAAGFGADAIYSFWAGRIPVGIRYDMWTEDREVSTFDRSVDYTLVQAIIGYRFFLTGKGYLGAVAAIPVSGDTKYKDLSGSFKADSETFSGGTIGLEGALRIKDNYTVGVEAGMSVLKAEDFESSGGTATYNGKKMEMDLTGTYYRAVFGLMF